MVKFFLLTSALAAGLFSNPVFSDSDGANRSYLANFEQESASQDARQIADWVLDSRDNQNMPFLIIDKKNAKVFVFDPAGQIMGASAVLLGVAVGDDSSKGVGQRKLSSIPVAERTTPAGRFVAELDRNVLGQAILWLDYAQAISLHPVRSAHPSERRLERLASATARDNRISYGCINVPKQFFDKVVKPSLSNYRTVVYIMPEVRDIQSVFKGYKKSTEVSQSAPF